MVMMPESSEVSDPEATWMTALPAPLAVNTALLPSPLATRSPATTLPVTDVSDQVAAALATKALLASRDTAYTVMELPVTMVWAGTSDPEPSAAVSTPICVAVGPAVVTVPWTSKSLTVGDGPTSKTYQVPDVLVASQLTMRKVTVVPVGTFCRAEIPERSIGRGVIAAPVAAVLE